MSMADSVFLPGRPLRIALPPWIAGAMTAGGIFVGVAAAGIVQAAFSPDDVRARGVETIIELADMETATAAATEGVRDGAAEDRAAVPQVTEVQSASQQQTTVLTEQASPEAPDDPDLQMAHEQTRQPTAAPPEERQTSEAARPEAPSVQSVESSAAATFAADAAPVADRSVAPEQGNERDAARRLEAWHRAVFGHILAFKTYPEASRHRSSAGEVLLHFSVGRDGAVQVAQLQRSSGDTVLDRAALDVLRRASPLPRPPAGLREDALELLLPLKYRLR